MHHHGYTWLGSAYELDREAFRRPSHPEFRSSAVVPLELAHWLLKPPGLIKGTWHDPRKAARWFGERAWEHAPAFASDHEREAGTLSDRIERAAEAAASGEDVAGGWYLTGQRFYSVCLVTCGPNRVRPEITCPQR